MGGKINVDCWNLKYIGPTIIRLRRRNLWTQEDLEWYSSLNRKTISQLENNQEEPLISTISALAAAFQMDPSEFLKEVENDIIRNRKRN